MIRFGSVCSGIEAASVAWRPLGWEAAWLSEIEPFPCAVLAHHYPDVPNLGDMTTIVPRIRSGEIEAPDVFTGGTPCQAFSVAGLRRSLEDARGNLSLTFVEIANAIDDVRAAAGREPGIVVWENVPGVLSTADNAFGCFLGALAGADDALPAPQAADGELRWSDAGVVLGPRRAVCWRILDAQFFGLAQRRRRVFVVASARDGFDPGAVLLEFEGVRRDSAPRREAGEGASRFAGGGPDGGSIAGSVTSKWAKGSGGPAGDECYNMVAEIAPTLLSHGNATGGNRQPGMCVDTCTSLIPVTAHTLRGDGFDASEDGTGRGTPLVPVCCDGEAVAFAQNQRDEVRTMDVAGALAAEPGAKQQTYIAFSAKDHGADAGELAPTLRAMGHAGSHANGGGQVAVATTGESDASAYEADSASVLRTLRKRVGAEAVAEWGSRILDSLQSPEVLRAWLHGESLRCASGDLRSFVDDCPLPREEGVPARAMRDVWENGPDGRTPQGRGLAKQLAFELGKALPELPPALAPKQSGMHVRRLTPKECERLMGFPDSYTAIPWRGRTAEACPDGPRYKALGNSWAVPCARWIGERIAAAVEPRGENA